MTKNPIPTENSKTNATQKLTLYKEMNSSKILEYLMLSLTRFAK